jgi:hypothetical protein
MDSLNFLEKLSMRPYGLSGRIFWEPSLMNMLRKGEGMPMVHPSLARCAPQLIS